MPRIPACGEVVTPDPGKPGNDDATLFDTLICDRYVSPRTAGAHNLHGAAMPSNNRNSHAAAMRWASQVSTISFEFALPIAGGYWLDLKWGTTPWLTVVGLVFGGALGFLGLVKLLRDLDR